MLRRRVSRLALLLVPALLVLQLVGPVVTGMAPRAEAAAPTDGQMTLRVREALRAGVTGQAPIVKYKWLISAEKTDGQFGYVPGADGQLGYDAVGDPTDSAATRKQCTPGTVADKTANVGNGFNPNTCQWPSIRYTPGAVPIVAEGDQDDFAPGTDGFATKNITLKPGRYLVSVTADGHKIDGAHFDVDGNNGVSNVVVDMYAYPLPTGTLRLRVFKDTAPVDGTYEADIEQALRGFHVHINDVLGEVTTDFYGNPLCTNYVHETKLANNDPNFTVTGGLPHAGYSTSNYDITSPVVFDADGLPVVDPDDPGGTCASDGNGDVAIPYLGPDRYTATVIPPTGQSWYQTTTLEGNHDWDMWIAEAETGFDTEFTVGGEPVPPVDMGFVPFGTGAGTSLPRVCTPQRPRCYLPAQSDRSGATIPTTGETGSVSGVIEIINTYIGGSGGVVTPNAGVAGANVRGPINKPIVTLSDLNNNDQMVYVGRGDANGKFTITGVPEGDYQLTAWDFEQDYIIDSFNVTVHNGEHVDVGQKGLVGWYTDIKGSVFVDTNGNGKRDPGEAGVPKFAIAVKQRDNSLLDAGQNTVQTDNNGNYEVTEGYPTSKWWILEAFNTLYKTTGVTVQADNEPTAHTYKGAAVDISVLPIIGLSGRIDWGVQPYKATENGGIAATVTYDTTRNELDPAYAVTEDYQPGIPGLTMHLYYPLKDPSTGEVLYNADGSARVLLDSNGKPLDVGGRDANPDGTYTTETWDEPTGCTSRMYDGTPLTDQAALPPFGNDNYICTEAPMSGWQGVPSDKTADAFGQTVNGNYAFASLGFDPSALATEAARQAASASPVDGTLSPSDALPADQSLPITDDDFVVKVDIPTLSNGKPLYKPTQEEDVNVFDGDTRMPQENFPIDPDTTPPSGDVGAGAGDPVSQGNGITSPCVGANHQVNVTDGGFLSAGGSPFEGLQRHLCDEKLIDVRGGQAVAPNFNLFTEVPLPTHFYGLTINDLGLSQDKTQAGYGEAQPLPDVPMGIYDWSGKLVDTVSTDWNGYYEALEPSTSSYNCPLPAGPCPGMYYFKGNDPGQPGHVNANYNPRFRTIGTEFQAWPGLWTVTDTAPTQVGVIAVAPGTAQINPVQCDVNAGTTGAAQKTPDLYSVSQPYVKATVTNNGQTLPVTAVAISTAPNNARNIQLTVNGTLNSPTTPLANGNTVSVNLSNVQVTATQNLTTTQRNRLNGNQTVTGVTATTITYRITNASTVPTTTRANNATGSVTLPNYSAPITTARTITIKGAGFGTAPQVKLTPAGSTTSYTQAVSGTPTDNQVTVTLGTGNSNGSLTPGIYRLSVTNTVSGRTSVNGLTFHVLGTIGAASYNPTLIQVNPPAAFAGDSSRSTSSNSSPLLNLPSAAFPAQTAGNPDTDPENVLQRAVDRAANYSQALLVVWPNTPATNNPTGDYFENVVVHSPVKIQGVGPGGGAAADVVPGSRLNGLGFNPDNLAGTNWVATVAGITHDGPADVPDAAVVTYLGRGNAFGSAYAGALDGFTVTGGSQADFATSPNAVYGNTQTPVGAPNALITQGGGIYLHASANNVQLSDNIIVGNSGSYGGGIRIGTPYTAVETSANNWNTNASHNTGVVISHNRIRDNGGTNLAGGVGIFDGSTSYVVDGNDLCGNFSAEYGGALSHYGLSGGGRITNNRVYLNQSYDEGGGVMIAGELNPNLTEPSAGAGGSILIDANLVSDNLANDDGGGLRFLQAGDGEVDVRNNVVSDNISAHEGGGIALDDSTNVHITGNTVAKNLTTATAITSNGQPAPAGLSTATNSDQLQARLRATNSPRRTVLYSNPQDFRDNIFFQNLAGTWDPTSGTVRGINPASPAADPKRVWEMGSVDGGITLAPTYSVLSQYDALVTASATNKVDATDNYPAFRSPYDVGVQIITSRAFPSFREAAIVANAVAPNVQGDYHLSGTGSPASNAGPATTDAALLGHDIDGATRSNPVDIGADELP